MNRRLNFTISAVMGLLFFARLQAEAQDPFFQQLNQAQTAIYGRDWLAARTAIHHVLELGAREKLSSESYNNLLIAHVRANWEIDQDGDALKALQSIDFEQLNDQQYLEASLLAARLAHVKSELIEAYHHLKRADSKISSRLWPVEDQTLFTRVRFSLENYWDEVLERGKHSLEKGAFHDALAAFIGFLQGVREENVPGTESPKARSHLERATHLLVAKALANAHELPEAIAWLQAMPAGRDQLELIRIHMLRSLQGNTEN